MPEDSIQDSTRYVVSDVHHGSVLPGQRKEMERNVFLLPGADVRGGLWSNDLSVAGPDIRVADSVYSQGAITVDVDEDVGSTDPEAEVTFEGSVTTPDALLIDTDQFRSRFLSDLYTERINLSNAFVFGNIYARNAVVRDSVVLGGIFCKGPLEIENSFVHTFQAHRAEVGENTSIFAPFALADDDIQLEAPVRALTFADIFSGDGASSTSGDVVHLNDDDLFSIQRAAGQASGDGEPGTQTVLSMTERILDSERVQGRLEENKKFLRRLSLHRHVEEEKKKDGLLQELEERLWALIEEPVTEDPSARKTRPLEQLIEKIGLS